MDEEMSRKESEALDAISNCIVKRLRGKVEYSANKVAEKRNKEVPVISPQVQKFWDNCIATFEEEIISLFYGRDFKLQKTDGPMNRKKYPLVRILSNKDDPVQKFWTEPMYSCIVAFAQVMRAADIELEQKKDIIRLFTELRTKLERYEERNARKKGLNGSILGAVNLKRIPYMLDLQEKPVRELLPYLLTAYIFNAWNNRFFTGNMKLVPLICNEYSASLNPMDVSKMIPGAKNLAQIFSLNGRKKDLQKLPDAGNNEHPIPFGTLFDKMEKEDIKSPYIRYKEVLDWVFPIWIDIIYDQAPIAEIDGFPSDIDFKTSEELYSGYTK